MSEYGQKIGEKFQEYYPQLIHENDRGSVIITSVILEETLQKMLKKNLIPSPGKSDELFKSPYAPLNNFSAKIDMAYRVGLIRHHIRSTLHLIRKIRNDFAHSKLVDGFESNEVKSRINEIFKLNQNILDTVWGILRDDLSKHFLDHGDNVLKSEDGLKSLVEILDWRGTFDLLAAITCAGLNLAVDEIIPLKPLDKESA
ncbi:hypothetical protein [Rhodohalobacter sp. 614A]|uniref:hypothetical protein n=1 Tax=Rhodohalobacter sp. 614A TaxID=2908649 RepID=UPI001F209143|nr:hypothetical protein [Rhodohalobacter sp. 614A]